MKEAQNKMLRLAVVASLLPSFVIIAYCFIAGEEMGDEEQKGCLVGLIAVWGLYFVGQWAIKDLSLEPPKAARVLAVLLFVAAVCIAVVSIIAEGRPVRAAPIL